MPEASQPVAGGERRDTTGSHNHKGPHPGRGASAAAPPKPARPMRAGSNAMERRDRWWRRLWRGGKGKPAGSNSFVGRNLCES